MNKNIVICDIDGTISRVGERLQYLQQTPPDWDKFYDDCFDDEPIEEMCMLVRTLHKAGYTIVFCTGRRDSVREKTEAWIKKYVSEDFVFPRILMRPTADHRHDAEVKPELLEMYLSEQDRARIAFILEDRDSMVDKWRELGYRCLQVAKGDF